MKDRNVKIFLGVIALLLAANLIRPPFGPTPLYAQGPAAPAVQASLSVSDRMIYVLQGHPLTIYYVDLGTNNPFELLKRINEGKLDDILKNSKLRPLLRQDLSQMKVGPK